MKKRVLFVCIHNSARSQMAEELLRKLGGNRFEVESAGIEPGKLNPTVIEVLKEDGIDITGKPTKAVWDLVKNGNCYSYVITVCDEASAENVPFFPGYVKDYIGDLPIPSKFEGTWEEKIIKTRAVREEIRHKIEAWLNLQQGV